MNWTDGMSNTNQSEIKGSEWALDPRTERMREKEGEKDTHSLKRHAWLPDCQYLDYP